MWTTTTTGSCGYCPNCGYAIGTDGCGVVTTTVYRPNYFVDHGIDPDAHRPLNGDNWRSLRDAAPRLPSLKWCRLRPEARAPPDFPFKPQPGGWPAPLYPMKGSTMAEKATRLPTLQAAPSATMAPGDQAQIEQLASAAAKANKKKADAAARKSNVPDEVKLRNWEAITAAIAARKAIEKELKQAKAFEGACFSTAKDDGCNIEAIKRVLREQKIDSDEFDADMKEAAYLARLVKSPLAETSFMRILEDADKVNPYTQGFTAGKAGDDLANSPHDPGSAEFEKYEKGWRDGQAKLAEGLGRGKKASAKKAATASAKLN